jgi:hypothetical protein
MRVRSKKRVEICRCQTVGGGMLDIGMLETKLNTSKRKKNERDERAFAKSDTPCRGRIFFIKRLNWENDRGIPSVFRAARRSSIPAQIRTSGSRPEFERGRSWERSMGIEKGEEEEKKNRARVTVLVDCIPMRGGGEVRETRRECCICTS